MININVDYLQIVNSQYNICTAVNSPSNGPSLDIYFWDAEFLEMANLFICAALAFLFNEKQAFFLPSWKSLKRCLFTKKVQGKT